MPFFTSTRRLIQCAFLTCAAVFASTQITFAQFGAGSEQLIRVAWQDAQDKSLHWGEFVQVRPSIVFQDQGKVAGFPALTGNQALGTMKRIDNMLAVSYTHLTLPTKA